MKSRTVLFVDDEVNILNSLRRGLIDEEYECLFADSGQAALKILAENEISVLVTDMKMPEMDGLTLLKIVKEKYPTVVCLVLSGYTQLQQILATINQVDIFKFITKPWKMEEEFKHIINQALDYYNLQAEREELKKALENKNIAYQQMLKEMARIIENLKRESLLLKETSKLAFNCLDDWFADEGEELRERLSFVKKIFVNYTEIVPSQVTEFDLQKFFERVLSILKNFSQISTLDYSSDIKESYKVKGNLTVLFFLLNTFFQSFLTINGQFYVKINSSLKEKKDNNVDLEITVLLADVENNSKQEAEKNIDDKLTFVRTIFQQVLKHLAGNFAITRVEHKLAFKVALSLCVESV